MKFIKVSGGLGNQMFNYAFCLELRQLGYNTSLLVTRLKSSNAFGYQGYELDKLFNVQTSIGISAFWLSVLLVGYSTLIRIFPGKLKDALYKVVGINIVRVKENFIFYPETFNFENVNQLFLGTWQSEHYFANAFELVKKQFVFNQELISVKSKSLSTIIANSISVSIHVRRGDYLSDQYICGFGNICTLDYYRRALAVMEAKLKTFNLFVFTDDQEWVQENFNEFNPVFVNHNIGPDSWQDMYLMSKCKHNIIANSSFSWWGAWLNSNPEKIVIAPEKWWNGINKDDVVPASWIRV